MTLDCSIHVTLARPFRNDHWRECPELLQTAARIRGMCVGSEGRTWRGSNLNVSFTIRKIKSFEHSPCILFTPYTYKSMDVVEINKLYLQKRASPLFHEAGSRKDELLHCGTELGLAPVAAPCRLKSCLALNVSIVWLRISWHQGPRSERKQDSEDLVNLVVL